MFLRLYFNVLFRIFLKYHNDDRDMTDNDWRETGNDIQEGFLYILVYHSSGHLIKMLCIVCDVHCHFMGP